MRPSIRDAFLAIGPAALAGLGGAAAVLADFDDAPGGMLIGFLLVVVAAALNLRALTRAKRSAE